MLCEQIGLSLDDFIATSLEAMCRISDRLGL
jgi:predicted hydrolase (HD superfamily)